MTTNPLLPSRPRTAHRPGPQTGVSMIEVLIALLLVALGTLAIAALQLSSKRNNIDAAQRAIAAQVGYGFLERIRGNNTSAGLIAYQAAAAAGFGGGLQATPGADCGDSDGDGTSATCDSAQLAEYDAWAFEQELDGVAEQAGGNNVGGLLTPAACLVASNPGGGSTNFALTLVWRGNGAIADNVAVTCAQGTGDYGADDEFRRTLTLNAFVVAR